MDDFDKIIATAKVIARPESAVDEIASLRKQLKELEITTYCAYCGERFALDDKAATFVTKHIHTCTDHPMRLVEAERDALRRQLEVAREAINETMKYLAADYDESCKIFSKNVAWDKLNDALEKIGG